MVQETLTEGATYRSMVRVMEHKKKSKHQRLSREWETINNFRSEGTRMGECSLDPRVKNHDLTGVVVMGKGERCYNHCPSRGSRKS